MSETLRIYYREYGTGRVELEGGYGNPSYNPVREWTLLAAQEYANKIGATVQQDKDGGCHVIKTSRYRADGRYYFLADSPAQVPLGEGWKILNNPDADPGQDMVFGFNHKDQAVTLTWKALTEAEIDNQHGNDEFGGWHKPVIKVMDRASLEIDLDAEEGETDAIRLMMDNSDTALEWINKR